MLREPPSKDRGEEAHRRAVASLIAEFLFAFDPDRIIATRAVAG
jgi:hypothetical protein